MYLPLPRQFFYAVYRLEIRLRRLKDNKQAWKTGSAFVLADGRGSPWVVTNRHVIDPQYGHTEVVDIAVEDIFLVGRRADDSRYRIRIIPTATQLVHSDPENDVVLLQPFVSEPKDPNNRIHWHFSVGHLANVAEFDSDIFPGEPIHICGFPGQYDRLGYRPIMRTGHIASDPRYDYSTSDQPMGSRVAYDGFALPGSSGSPVIAPARSRYPSVLEMRQPRLIGVNALYASEPIEFTLTLPDDPKQGHEKPPELDSVEETTPSSRTMRQTLLTHSGISIFFKSTVILEILDKEKYL